MDVCRRHRKPCTTNVSGDSGRSAAIGAATMTVSVTAGPKQDSHAGSKALGLLVTDAALDDDVDALEEGDVTEYITADRDDVGVLAGAHGADLAVHLHRY